MAITVRIQTSALEARLKNVAASAVSMLADRLRIETGMLAEYIKRDKLSGQVLKNRTGNLRNSVFSSISQSISGPTGALTGTVAVDSTAWYGKLHEYGGTFHVESRRLFARGSAQLGALRSHKAKITRGYDIHFPERSFMRSALAERADAIKQGLQQALNAALKK